MEQILKINGITIKLLHAMKATCDIYYGIVEENVRLYLPNNVLITRLLCSTIYCTALLVLERFHLLHGPTCEEMWDEAMVGRTTTTLI